VVVGTRVDPEQLGVALDLAERLRLDAFVVGEDGFEDTAHLQRAAMLLVVEDVAPGKRRLGEVIRQRLVFQRQRRELIRIDLHDRGIVYALEQVFPLARRGGCACRWGGRRGCGFVSARTRGRGYKTAGRRYKDECKT